MRDSEPLRRVSCAGNVIIRRRRHISVEFSLNVRPHVQDMSLLVSYGTERLGALARLK